MTAPLRKNIYIPLGITIGLTLILMVFGVGWLVGGGWVSFLLYGLYIILAQFWVFRSTYFNKKPFLFSNILHIFYFFLPVVLPLFHQLRKNEFQLDLLTEAIAPSSILVTAYSFALLALQFIIIKNFRP